MHHLYLCARKPATVMYLQNYNVLFTNITHRNPLCVYQRLQKCNRKAFKYIFFCPAVLHSAWRCPGFKRQILNTATACNYYRKTMWNVLIIELHSIEAFLPSLWHSWMDDSLERVFQRRHPECTLMSFPTDPITVSTFLRGKTQPNKKPLTSSCLRKTIFIRVTLTSF